LKQYGSDLERRPRYLDDDAAIANAETRCIQGRRPTRIFDDTT
jgi:hypothetical protein